MSWVEFIQSSIFATILTLSVSIVTCVINRVQGYKKMKLEHFEAIYNCLELFTIKRAEVTGKCSELSKEIGEKYPDGDKVSEKNFLKWYDSLYCGINEMIAEYSICLELYLSISHFLYKYKSLRPIIKVECWELLRLYEGILEIGKKYHYNIRYAQIVDLVQFIKITGTWKDKKALRKYLNEHQIVEF